MEKKRRIDKESRVEKRNWEFVADNKHRHISYLHMRARYSNSKGRRKMGRRNDVGKKLYVNSVHSKRHVKLHAHVCEVRKKVQVKKKV